MRWHDSDRQRRISILYGRRYARTIYMRPFFLHKSTYSNRLRTGSSHETVRKDGGTSTKLSNMMVLLSPSEHIMIRLVTVQNCR